MPLRVLMVEDSPDDAELILRELRSAGLDVLSRCVATAEGMRAALHQEEWDVVLSDHAMPRFSSDAALDLLKKSGLDLPFIIVSGTIGEEHAVAAMRAGAHDYIMKDNLKRLPPAVQRELREAQGREARRQVEQDRRQLETQLQQAQKMQSLGVLAGGIAHDFNNLLTVIRSNAQLLSSASNPDPVHQRCVQDIELAASHAVDMVRSLQTFSRPRLPEVRRVDANVIIRDVHRLLSRLMPANVEFRAVTEEASPCVFSADPSQIQQILVNLCVNARDAMPAGGTLELRAGRAGPEALPVAARKGAAEQQVCLTVRDTGVGMDEETLGRAFDPFFTTKPKDRGTGLGLALVYRIVEAHQGTIDVGSRPGHGTTFRLFFPATPAPPDEEDAARMPEGGTEHVLVVNGDDMIASLLQTLLEDRGYQVEVARRAEEAADLAEVAQPPFELAIIDAAAPAAERCLKQLRRIYPDLPVVLISSNGGTLMEAADPNVHLISKPFNITSLARLIRQVLNTSAAPQS